MNQIYYTVDTIHQAIAANRQIAFQYFEYTVEPGLSSHWKKQYRRGGEKYTASPYALSWDDENYYMIAFMFGGKEEKIKLQFDNSLIGIVLDRFGKDVMIRRADENSFYQRRRIDQLHSARLAL